MCPGRPGGLAASGPARLSRAGELLARVIMLIIAFVPFFAFWEIGRVLGPRKLSALFFSRRETPALEGGG